MVESRLMRLVTVLGFALAAVAALPGAGATNAPTGRIAFSMRSPIPSADIYAVNADGSGLVRLTEDPAADFDPSWSPDGRRIAYRHEDERSGQIYVMNADGSQKRNLTRRRGLDYSPAWSPDGRSIAFGSVRAGKATIWVMRPDGSGRRRLSRVYGEYPAWSPDGRKIAFDHIDFGSGSTDWDIWVMNADGSRARPLIASGASEQGPAWSPDGNAIAYQSDRGAPGNYARVWLARSDGSRRHLLRRRLGERPTWSKRGGYVLFTGLRIFVVRRDGSGLRSVRVPGEPFLADWTR
jgi:Tol biopolymer transport system component